MNKIIVLHTTILILFCGIASSFGQTVSDEAKRHFDRGMAAVEMAKTAEDYGSAIKEFEQAAKLAPDWPDVYYNLGMVQEKAEKYSDAVTNLKQYLRLAPNASDAETAKSLINKLEYRAEKQEEARPKEIKGDGRFISYNNGTVLDTSTNLMWAAKDNGSDIDWQRAKNYCENYRGGGYTDWRMPTVDELAMLYDASKPRTSACGLNYSIAVATELIDITCDSPWASQAGSSDAAYFGFHSGSRKWGPKSDTFGGRALPVRSSK
jgi:tetratricopeptide (TPR) repeat protein